MTASPSNSDSNSDAARELLARHPTCVDTVQGYLQIRGLPGLAALPPEEVPGVVATVLDHILDEELRELMRSPRRQLHETTARSLNLLDELEQCGVRPWTLTQLERLFSRSAA